MAENLGAIRYEVEMETASMLKSEGVINKSIATMAASFDKADKAVREFEATQKSLGRTINSMGQVVTANGKVVANATQQYRGLADTAQTGFNNLNTQITKTAKGVRSARPDMQNMSYQLQDMAVQAQMGTSAFVIMAQQLPQMLVGMGAWAGAIGVAITVLGLMATTMIDTTSDMEKLEKAIEQVKAVMTVGSNGVATYTDEMRKLSNISKELLQIKLNTALAQQQNALKLVGEAAKEAYKDATPFFNLNWDNYKNSQEAVFDNIIDDAELEKLGRAHPLIDNAMNGVYGLNNALKSIENGNVDAGIKQITSALGYLSTSAAQNTEEGRQLITTMTSLVEKYKLGKITLDQLKNSVDGTTDSFNGNADALQDYLKGIELSTLSIQGNERALEKRRLELTDMSEQEQITALAAWDYMKKVEAQTIATEEAIEADKKRKKSLDDVSSSLDAYFEKENADSNKKQEREEGQAVGFAQGVVDRGKSQAELFAEEQQELFELREKGLIDQELYDQAVVASVKSRNEQIKQANENQLSQQALFTESQSQLLGSLGNLFGSYADNMEVDDKKSFEKKKKFQTAQALINTAMAVSNALASAPPPINFGLAAAAGAMGAMQVSAIQNQQYSGGRQYGGPVSNGMYRVNETGVPEVYSQGGKDYLMNTKNANITPLDKASGGGSETFNINYNMQDTSDSAFQQQAMRNADLFVSIVRSYKNNQGESF